MGLVSLGIDTQASKTAREGCPYPRLQTRMLTTVEGSFRGYLHYHRNKPCNTYIFLHHHSFPLPPTAGQRNPCGVTYRMSEDVGTWGEK